MKAPFIKRLVAYILDIIVVSIASAILALPFTMNDNYTKLYDNVMEVNTNYIKGEIDADTYTAQNIDASYDFAYAAVIVTIIQIVCYILYFGILPVYNKGQTVGKKLMHIKIQKSDDSKLGVNDMVIRAFIINSIFTSIITLLFTVFSNKTIYYYGSNALVYLQDIIIVISAFMILYRKDKRGLHDIICKTEVITV